MLHYYLFMPRMMAYFYLPYAYMTVMWMPWMYPYLYVFFKQFDGDRGASRKQNSTAPTASNHRTSKANGSKTLPASTADRTLPNDRTSEEPSVRAVSQNSSNNRKPEVEKPTPEAVGRMYREVKDAVETEPETQPIKSVQPPEATPPRSTTNPPERRQPATETVSTSPQIRENLKTARRLVNLMSIATLEDVDRLTLMRAKPLLKSLGISQSTNGKKKKVAELRDEIKQKLLDFELV